MSETEAQAEDAWTAVVADGPAERLHFETMDALTEVTHPMRGRLVQQLRHPASAADVAAALDVPVTRLYHHLKRLEAAGIIRVVATRRVGSATERRYQVSALSFGPSPELLESGEAADFAVALGSVFDFAKLEFQRELEAHGPGPLDERESMLSLSHASLTAEQRSELVKRLTAVVEEVLAESEEPGADVQGDDLQERTSVFLAVFPTS